MNTIAKELAAHHAQAVPDQLERTAGGHLSSDEVARRARMLLRTDLDHEAVCVMARDRIVWLERQLKAVAGAVVEDDGGTKYEHEEDEVGTRACCHVASYRDHEPGCYVTKAKAALAALGGGA